MQFYGTSLNNGNLNSIMQILNTYINKNKLTCFRIKQYLKMYTDLGIKD